MSRALKRVRSQPHSHLGEDRPAGKSQWRCMQVGDLRDVETQVVGGDGGGRVEQRATGKSHRREGHRGNLILMLRGLVGDINDIVRYQCCFC